VYPDPAAPFADGQTHSGGSFTESERNAMRAYLQRTEVRLSTLHRIAVTFISGAGLLLLFPTFFREEISVLLRVFLERSSDVFFVFGANQLALAGLMFVLLIYPFVLSLTIPIYGLFLLLKDIVHFYFTIYTPGFPTGVFTPSFALTGITFSPDESERIKRAIYGFQYDASAVNFAIPFSAERREKYFSDTIENTNGEIIPPSRRPAILNEYGIIPENAEHEDRIAHLNAAFGLARMTDRRLLEEVATQEISMTRHVLYLRRLVMRYMKTLLMFVWTTVVAFVMLPFLNDARLPTFLLIAIGYSVWSLLAMPIMHIPLNWIYRHKKDNWDKTHIDPQLMQFENQVRIFVYGACASSLIAVALSALVYFR
jgi:hypothetical protein